MSSTDDDLTVLQANFLAAVVAASGSTAAEIGDLVESVYGVELPQGRVYNNLSRITTLGLVAKSEHRGSRGKAITPTRDGRDLAEEQYAWIVDRFDEVANR